MPSNQPPDWAEPPPWIEEERASKPQGQPQQQRQPYRGGSSAPRQNTAMAKAAQPINGLQLDEDGKPLFQDDVQRHAYMANMIATGFLPKHLDTPAKAVLAMRACENAGLPWEQWVGKTYLINGQLAVYVAFQRAAAEKTGNVDFIRVRWLDEDGNPKTGKNAKGFKVFAAECRVKAKDSDEVQEVVYSFDDVDTAKFQNKNYGLHPGDMLMWRAMGRALQIVFPMVCDGLQIQGIHDMAPMLDEGGKQVTTPDGVPVYQQRRARARARMDALRGPAQGGSNES